MTKITIGGIERDLQPLVFRTIKQIWPIMQSVNTCVSDVMTATGCTRDEALYHIDPIWQIEQGVRIIAFVIAQDDPSYVDPIPFGQPGHNVDFAYDKLEKELKSSEVPTLQPVIDAVMIESGFDMTGPTPEGKKTSGESSMETGTDSSPNSLQQDVKEEAGT